MTSRRPTLCRRAGSPSSLPAPSPAPPNLSFHVCSTLARQAALVHYSSSSPPKSSSPPSLAALSRLLRRSPTMPKIKTSRTKPPPEGFEEVCSLAAAVAAAPLLTLPCPSLRPPRFAVTSHQIETILEDYNRKMRDGKLLWISYTTAEGERATRADLRTTPNNSRGRIPRGQAQDGNSLAHHAYRTHPLEVRLGAQGEGVSSSLRSAHRLSRARRYIYDLYYKREAISRELYDWLLKEEYADAK